MKYSNIVFYSKNEQQYLESSLHTLVVAMSMSGKPKDGGVPDIATNTVCILDFKYRSSFSDKMVFECWSIVFLFAFVFVFVHLND